jgi:membrane protein
MGEKTEALRGDLASIGGDLRGLADALRDDPKVEQRKQLGWRVLYGGLAAGSTLVARRLANRTWHVLTGEGGTADSAPNGHAGKEQTSSREPGRNPGGAREEMPSGNAAAPTEFEESNYEAAKGRPLPDQAPEPQPEHGEPTLRDPGIRDLTRADWIAVFKRAGKETLDDNVPMIASALAYASFFAIPSVLLVAVGLFTLVAGPDTITSLMQHFGTFMPGDATSLLGQSLHQLDAKPSSGIVMTIVGFVLAVWSTTGAMNSYMTALNIAYDRKDRRTFVKKRLVALQMAAAIGFAFVLIAVLLIFGPTVEHWVGTTLHVQPVLGWLWWTIQWPLLVVGLLAAFATTYFLGPDVDHPRWRLLTVGSAVAVVMWLAASGLFAVYTSTFASYNKTWGSLSAVIVMLTWLWITGIALLFGAELNAEIERSRELRKGEPAEESLQAPHQAEARA